MTEYLLLAILFLALTTFYLHYRVADKIPFDKVIKVYLGISILDALNMFIAFYFFVEHPYVNWAAPFGLIYGPLFYFAYQAAHGHLQRKNQIVWHVLPFILFYIAYVYLISNASFRTEEHLRVYFIILHSCIAISMISYGVWGVLFKGLEIKEYDPSMRTHAKEYIAAVGTPFIVVAILFVVLMFMNYQGLIIDTAFLYAYFMMFFVLLITFRYTVNRMIKQEFRVIDPQPVIQSPVGDIKMGEEVGSYQKSAVSELFLDSYEEKLDQKIKEQVYLDPELTLDSLATELKVTKHHLTQILNLGIGQSFNQYINQYRIEYACKLLKDSSLNLSIEELALESGFNSKSSFNRNFKSQMGCTPSQYRLKEGVGL